MIQINISLGAAKNRIGLERS